MKYTEVLLDKQKKNPVQFILHTNDMKEIKITPDWWRDSMYIYYHTKNNGVCHRVATGVGVYVEVRK